MGWTALSVAADHGHYSLLKWMLTEGGALITDVTVQDDVHSFTVWDSISESPDLPSYDSASLLSLLKVVVLLDDAPADFIAIMSPQNAEIVAHAEIVTRGREIRALRPSYLEQQHALVSSTSPLPSVLQAIVATYAEPTPEDMWTD
jgi:hypothetical protein